MDSQVSRSRPPVAPRCSHCGNRLFLESELRGRRLHYYWECLMGCSRQFNLDGSLVAYPAPTRTAPAVRELVPVGAR